MRDIFNRLVCAVAGHDLVHRRSAGPIVQAWCQRCQRMYRVHPNGRTDEWDAFDDRLLQIEEIEQRRAAFQPLPKQGTIDSIKPWVHPDDHEQIGKPGAVLRLVEPSAPGGF